MWLHKWLHYITIFHLWSDTSNSTLANLELALHKLVYLERQKRRSSVTPGPAYETLRRVVGGILWDDLKILPCWWKWIACPWPWSTLAGNSSALANLKHVSGADTQKCSGKNPAVSFPSCKCKSCFAETAVKLHVASYITQTHESGTMIRKGPLTLFFSIRWVISAIVCMVLPRPISSARIPFKLLL